MPVLGVIFLRHATTRYENALAEIQAAQATGEMPPRPLVKADFIKRRALMLPDEARYGHLLSLPKSENLGSALIAAMEAIERDFEPLAGQLPKDYGKFEHGVLETLLRTFDSQALREASGDVFGRIYEYFLMKFAMQGAQDNGEFFTPPSIVRLIVNVIEPDHGVIADLACGSGGMFVQSSHFIEDKGERTMARATFYGQEKTATTIRLAKMNLAVHGLEGDILEANTFYEDPHRLGDGRPLWGNCDYIMANPPFNVDMVDAGKIETDRRLPFGLPGVNKAGKVSNGNYLWASYFHSYLSEKGRAGFVMSSQASSAGHGEAEVRRKLVETGDVDVMIAIRPNFFYTRTVPCEIWCYDKGKPPGKKDTVLMLDARHIFRKVTRKIFDFSPEQQQNLTAIVWLYRGENWRFEDLCGGYAQSAIGAAQEAFLWENVTLAEPLFDFDQSLIDLAAAVKPFVESDEGGGAKELFADLQNAAAHSRATVAAFSQTKDDAQKHWNQAERPGLLQPAVAFGQCSPAASPAALARKIRDEASASPADSRLSRGKLQQAVAVHAMADLDANSLIPLAEAARDVTAAIETALKHAASLTRHCEKELNAAKHDAWDKRKIAKLLREAGEARDLAVDCLRRTGYFRKQLHWLLHRFPDGVFADVPGLCKAVSRAEIAAADWSLTPGRYVGVAPEEVDEDFDFPQETIPSLLPRYLGGSTLPL